MGYESKKDIRCESTSREFRLIIKINKTKKTGRKYFFNHSEGDKVN